MKPTTACMTSSVNTFKRAQRGLFAGKHIQFGNNKPFSLKKSRRTWLPNVQSKQLYSQILGRAIRIKVTAAALRTIDKKGGIDNYLLTTRDDKLKSEFGVYMKGVLQAKLTERGPRVSSKRPVPVPTPKMAFSGVPRLERAEKV